MLAYWGLSLQEACVRLEGRILTLPQVQANKHYNFQPGSAEFGDKIMSNSILKPVSAFSGVTLSCIINHSTNYSSYFTLVVIFIALLALAFSSLLPGRNS